MTSKLTRIARRLALIGALALPTASLWADDIDLYTGGPSITGASTNVLIFLDNSANWSNSNPGMGTTQGAAELAALKSIIDTLPDSVNLAIMMHSKTGSDVNSYVRYAMRPMNATNRARLKEVFDDITAAGPTSAVEKVAQSANGDTAIEQIFRYFNGLTLAQTNASYTYAIARDSKEDYSSNTTYAYSKSHPATTGSLGSYAYNSSASTSYNRPSDSNAGCAKNYVIWIGNTGLAGFSNSSEQTLFGDRLKATAAEVNVSVADLKSKAQIIDDANAVKQFTTYSSQGNDGQAPQSVMLDEWARFMSTFGVATTIDDPQNAGQKLRNSIITYTVDVFEASNMATLPTSCITSNSTPATAAPQHYIMQSTANAGGGKCFPATSTAQLTSALQSIFAEIQAVNSVFASATLPISVNTQGTYENQVYIGVFRPDQFSRPRWWGNLKQYQFARYCDSNNDDLVTDVGGPNDERIDRESGNTGTVPTCSGSTLKLFLADRNNKPAIDQTLTTGFISQTATSIWTSDSNFWSFSPLSTANNNGASDAPDGPTVERGGAAYRARTTMPVKTAASGTADIDHRKLYTCMGTCLNSGASSAQRLLGGNTYSNFNSSNTLITNGSTGRFDNAWPKTVSFAARSGTQVNATVSAGGLSFSGGETVTISGTGGVYDGSHTVLASPAPTATTFSFSVTESPADDASATVSTGSTTRYITAVSYSAATNKATMTSAAHGFQNNDSITIAGSTQTVASGTQYPLNGTFTISGVTINTFDITPQYISAGSPTTPATTAGSATINSPIGSTQTNAALRRLDTGTNPARVTGTWGASVPASGNPRITAGTTTVTVSGAVPTTYNGTYTIVETSTSCSSTIANNDGNRGSYYCYDLLKSETPATATTMTASKSGGTVIAAPITRSGTTATVNLAQAYGSNPATMAITSTNASYAGTKSVTWTSGSSQFTFPVTVTPSTSAIAVANGNPLVTLPGQSSVTASNLISWVRGVDVVEDENANSSFTDVRASIQGDVLHSRPLLINYGGSIGIVGFYGSNDGLLRAIKGGSTDSDGVEKWSFIPDEFVNFSKLSRQYSNSNLVRYPNSSCSISPAPSSRDYFWDGQLAVYQSTDTVKYPDATTGPYTRPAKTYLYIGMRRGGRSVYAIDVSDPDAPSFLWKIDSSMANFSQLGYTWSEPHVTKIKGKKADGTDDLRDVLVFGAGYDPTDDDQPSGCPRGDHSTALSTSSVSSGVTCPNAAGSYSGIGRGVFVVDALTGAYINLLTASASAMKYSFPADVAVYDADGDGYTDRIYAGDSGGQLFRFDVDTTQQLTASTAFKTYFLASLGDRTSTADSTRNGGTDSRKFLFQPDVLPFVYKKSNGTKVSAVMILAGTGDREKPLNNRDSNNNLNSVTCSSLYNSTYFGSKVRDRFFGIIDQVASGTDPATVSALTESTLFPLNTTTIGDDTLSTFNICYGFETTCGGGTNSLYNGWYLNLKNTVNSSNFRDEEKLVSAPKVISGMVLFGTNTPQTADTSSGVCSNLGQARSYAINPLTGLPSFDRDGNGTYSYQDLSAKVTGGGLPPTVTGGVVKIGEGFYRFLIGAGGSGTVSASPIAGAKNPVTVTGPRSRLFWSYDAD